jgi:small subunit ribosomal protein S20
MANIKSNIKSIRKNKKRNIRNKIVISTLKTNNKKFKLAPTPEGLKNVYKKTDSACSKGKISKNKANRIKSKLAKLNNKTVKALKEASKKVIKNEEVKEEAKAE